MGAKVSERIESTADRLVRDILEQCDAGLPSNRGWLPLGLFFILVLRGLFFRIGMDADSVGKPMESVYRAIGM